MLFFFFFLLLFFLIKIYTYAFSFSIRCLSKLKFTVKRCGEIQYIVESFQRRRWHNVVRETRHLSFAFIIYSLDHHLDDCGPAENLPEGCPFKAQDHPHSYKKKKNENRSFFLIGLALCLSTS